MRTQANHDTVVEVGTLVILLCLATAAAAEDWPEWRGRGRQGIWRETGILDRFPESGLKAIWRTPVHGGYTGPSVSHGRVFLTDYKDGIERALALDEDSGGILWTVEWPASYGRLHYSIGPRATPTVDADRVYVLGALGEMRCLRVTDGSVIWRRDFANDYGAEMPAWGTASAPIVDGNLLIAIVGGRPDAKLVAFDKHSGREVWRALSGEDSEPGYSQPVIVENHGRRVLLVWHAGALAALDPSTGDVFWENPYRIRMNTPIATPVVSGPYVLISAFFQGARLFRLDSGGLLWKASRESETRPDTLHAGVATPVVDGEYIYGICAYGQLRCLRLLTGEQIWESQGVLRERARNASAFIVKHGDRYFFHTDRGELVMGRLKPEGYEEISRTTVIQPTTDPGSRRELAAVNWVHPAFANGHIIVRNDKEVVRFSLRKPSRHEGR